MSLPARTGSKGAEKRTAALAIVAVFATMLPYLLGWWWTPEGGEFLWNHRQNSGDFPTYLSIIERVRAGEILVHNAYSVEEPSFGTFRPAYLLIGLLARVSGLPGVAAFHLGRLLFGALLVVAIYRLTGLFLEQTLERRLAVVLVTLGGGISWLGALMTGAVLPWPDSWQTEATVFGILIESPHFCFGLWLMLEFVIQLEASTGAEAPRLRRRHLTLAALALALGLFEQPYNLLLCFVLGAAVLLRRVPEGAAKGRLALAAWVCLLAAAIPLTWLLVLLQLDPAVASWSERNVLESPPPYAYLAAYAPLWVLAGVGLRMAWKELGTRRWLLVAWILGPALLIYLPVSFQRRMAEGWIVSLGILAAVAAARLRVPGLGRRVSAALFVTISCLGSIYLVSVDLRLYREQTTRSYSPAAMMEGLRYLRDHADLDDVVIASWVFSAWAPAHAPVRVVQGHRIQGVPSPQITSGVMAGLRKGVEAGRPPSFEAPLEGVRFLVFEGPLRVAQVLVLGDLRIASWWGPPAFRNSGLAIYELHGPVR